MARKNLAEWQENNPRLLRWKVCSVTPSRTRWRRTTYTEANAPEDSMPGEAKRIMKPQSQIKLLLRITGSN